MRLSACVMLVKRKREFAPPVLLRACKRLQCVFSASERKDVFLYCFPENVKKGASRASQRVPVAAAVIVAGGLYEPATSFFSFLKECPVVCPVASTMYGSALVRVWVLPWVERQKRAFSMLSACACHFLEYMI